MWEFERYDWSRLRAARSAAGIPAAITELVNATTSEEADAAYWKIDNEVVVQGALFESALPTTRCLTIALHRCTPAARPRVLELLVQLASGEAHPNEIEQGNAGIAGACGRELIAIAGLLFDLIERVGPDEDDLCVDLLGLCARHHHELRERVCWHLRQFTTRSKDSNHEKLVAGWIQELEM